MQKQTRLPAAAFEFEGMPQQPAPIQGYPMLPYQGVSESGPLQPGSAAVAGAPMPGAAIAGQENRLQQLSPLRGLPTPREPHPQMLQAAKQIRQELTRLWQEGYLPPNFDPQAALQDPTFLQLTVQMPVYAAARVYAAEQRAAQAEETAIRELSSRLRSREALPRQARADAGASPHKSYLHMTTEEFNRAEQEMRKRARNGENVAL